MQQTPASTITEEELETPQEHDEESVSGHMTNPESDDSIDEQVEEVGLYQDGDDNEVQEVDVAGEVEKAERSR